MRIGSERREKPRCRPRLNERIADTVADKIMHQRLLAKANLGLCRMHVHVNLVRWHLHEHEDDRKRCRRQDIAIGFADTIQNQAVTNQSAVDEDIDGIAIELLQLWL